MTLVLLFLHNLVPIIKVKQRVLNYHQSNSPIQAFQNWIKNTAIHTWSCTMFKIIDPRPPQGWTNMYSHTNFRTWINSCLNYSYLNRRTVIRVPLKNFRSTTAPTFSQINLKWPVIVIYRRCFLYKITHVVFAPLDIGLTAAIKLHKTT